MSLDDTFRREAEAKARLSAEAARKASQHELARKLYDESHCQAYVDRIVKHIEDDPTRRLSMRPFGHFTTYLDRGMFRDRILESYTFQVMWEGANKSAGDYSHHTIEVEMTCTGLLILKGERTRAVPQRKWQANGQSLEAAFSDLYAHPRYDRG